MRQITMTAEQTAAYDADDMAAIRAVYDQAQELADECGETVEVYTEDGILAEAKYPQA